MNRKDRRAALSKDNPSAMAANVAMADTLVSQGMQLHRAGKLADAILHYRKALKVHCDHLVALNLLADANLLLGRPGEAINAARKALALKPDMPGANLILGNALIASNRHEEAVEPLERAIALQPDYAEALQALGNALRQINEHARAIDLYERVIALKPGSAEAHYNLANALCAQKQAKDAIPLYLKAIELKPGDAAFHANLAGAALQIDDMDLALDHAQRALQIDPTLRSAWINSGNVHRTRGHFDLAEQAYRILLLDDPKDAIAHDLLANVLQGQNRHEEAEAEYRLALRLQPDAAPFAADLATALLGAGHLTEGWDLFEKRFEANAGLVRRQFGKAISWQGQPVGNGTLLIWREQGIGDELRFASVYADAIDQVTDQGGTCIIEAEHRLVSLFARSFPKALVRVEGSGSAFEKVDFEIAAGSLPRLFRRSIDEFPKQAGFLTPDPERRQAFARQLENLGPGLKVGIAWRSRNMSVNRQRFYTTLADWHELLGLPGLTLVNLQYDSPAEELAEACAALGAKIHEMPGLDLMNDLDGAAALTACLDLVVSPVTSVADMAGALAVPTLTFGPARHPMTLGSGRIPWFPETEYIHRQWNQPKSDCVAEITRRVRARLAG